MYNINSFNKELTYISNERRELVSNLLKLLPEYFYRIPASTSGKYHPVCSLGEGGLVRHTKTTIEIAKHLFTINKFTEYEQDVIVTALLLHDGFKAGLTESEHTKHEHPFLMHECLMNYSDISHSIFVADVANAVHSHMGQFNANLYSDCFLPLPKSKIERFVHMCDYLASRRNINVELG